MNYSTYYFIKGVVLVSAAPFCGHEAATAGIVGALCLLAATLFLAYEPENI